VAWSHNGKFIATGDKSKVIKIWDPQTGQESKTLTATDSVNSVALSPDDTQVAAGTQDNKVEIWDVASGTLLLTYTGHGAPVTVVAWSPDGKHFASGSDDGTVRIWDPTPPSDGSKTRNDETTGGEIDNDQIVSLAWAPDNTHYAMCPNNQYASDSSIDFRPAPVIVVELGELHPALEYKGHTAYALSVSWSPDGKYIASGSKDGTVQVWDPTSLAMKTKYTLQSPGAVQTVAWSPDSTRIAFTDQNGYVDLWNPDTTTIQYTFQHPSSALAWSPDGKSIASVEGQTVVVWHT